MTDPIDKDEELLHEAQDVEMEEIRDEIISSRIECPMGMQELPTERLQTIRSVLRPIPADDSSMRRGSQNSEFPEGSGRASHESGNDRQERLSDCDDRVKITDGALLQDLVAAFKRRRHPGDFYDHPSNEQMEMFKRGER